MADKYGYNTYLKLAVENTWGDGETPGVSIPITAENFKALVEMKPRASELRASRYPQTPRPGKYWSTGGWTMNAYPNLIGYLLLAAYGTPVVTTIATGVYDNVFEPGATVSKSLSVEISKAGINPLMIAGYMVNQLTFNQGIAGESQFLKATCDGGGKFGTEGSATAYTDPTIYPFQFNECVMTAASSTEYLDSITWQTNNGLVIPNHKISNGKDTKQPTIGGAFNASGSFVLNLEDLGNWDSFRNATDIAIVATYTTTQIISAAYVYTLTVTMPKVRYQQPLPDIANSDLAKETINFDMFAGTVGSSTVPISYTLRCATDFSGV